MEYSSVTEGDVLKKLSLPGTKCLIVLKTRKGFQSDLEGFKELLRERNWTPLLLASDRVEQKLTPGQKSQFALIVTFPLTEDEKPSRCWTNLSQVSFKMLAPKLELILTHISPDQCRLCVSEEPLIYMAASLRSKYGIPGLKLDSVLRFTNKNFMKIQLLSSNLDLQTAAWYPFITGPSMRSAEEIENKLNGSGIQYPVVIKPQSCCGSFDVRNIGTSAELSQWINDHQLIIAPYLAEKCLTGDQYAAYMLIFSNNIRWIRVFRNLRPIVCFIQHHLPLVKIEIFPIDSAHVKFLTRVVAAFLPIPNGMFTVEYFLSPAHQFQFLENCVRLPGGPLVTMMLLGQRLNIEVVHLAAQCYDNIVSQALNRVYMAYVRYPTKRGIVTAMHEAPKNLSSAMTSKWRIKIGQQMNDPTEVSGKNVALELMMFNSDYGKLIEDVGSVISSYEPFDFNKMN